MRNPFLDLIQSAVNKVKKMNQDNPNVKTADVSVFDAVKKRLQKSESKSHVNTEVEYCEDICEEINQVQVENKASVQVETADSSVFENMKKEIEALKAQMEAQKAQANPNVASASPAPPASSDEVMAMTNSQGGSLSLRAEPNMGAATNTLRVPDHTLVRILEYSENGIHLDGKQTRFVLIQFGDQQGWLLESYLNFN